MVNLESHGAMKCCIDRWPQYRAVSMTGALWKPGQIISIGFMGNPRFSMRWKTMYAAREWLEYANIRFEFRVGKDEFRDCDVRITFDGIGAWSYIGTECRTVRSPRPTMCFGWLDETSSQSEYDTVVKHEFGHMLGLLHEHQNPKGGIQWNMEAVYEYYGGPPNLWSKQEVDSNVIERYDSGRYASTRFDPDSIMLYPIPAALTINGFSTSWNNSISAIDKDEIGRLYPLSMVKHG